MRYGTQVAIEFFLYDSESEGEKLECLWEASMSRLYHARYSKSLYDTVFMSSIPVYLMISGDEYILATFLRLTRIRFIAFKSSLLTSSTEIRSFFNINIA